MNAWLAAVPLTSGWLPVAVDAAAVALLLVVAIRRPARRALIGILVGGVAGAGIGLLLCWVLGDLLDLFEVSLSPISRAWVAAAFGACGVCVAALIRSGAARRVAAGFGIPIALLAGALGVNADFGQYTTVGSLTGIAIAGRAPAPVLAEQRAGAPGLHAPRSVDASLDLWNTTTSTASRHGLVGTVVIPSTISHFAARPAYLYLPPAALESHPPALPVLVMLSGQPGAPENVIASAKLPAILDAFADAHHGIAPIVVIPDQLGAPQDNPMCVDSALGDSATYLTRDVPDWILTHLTVQTSPSAWAIGGFSQGGTCAIQLGAAHPDLFGGILDISGQVAPANGTVAQTIARGFAGDASAYRSALPQTVLAAGAPYADTVAVFASGEFDREYGPGVGVIAASAASAGMHVSRVVSPGTAHDWHTVQWALRSAMDPLYRHLGVERPS